MIGNRVENKEGLENRRKSANREDQEIKKSQEPE
jgi:hypothetical protein